MSPHMLSQLGCEAAVDIKHETVHLSMILDRVRQLCGSSSIAESKARALNESQSPCRGCLVLPAPRIVGLFRGVPACLWCWVLLVKLRVR